MIDKAEVQRRNLLEAHKGKMREKNDRLFWIMRLLQDENWSLWEGANDLTLARAMYYATQIALPGEQKALVRVIENERKEEEDE